MLDKGALSLGRLVCSREDPNKGPSLCARASLRPCHREAYFPLTAKCPLKCESGKLGLMCCLEIKVAAIKAWSFSRFCALWEFCRLSAKVLSQHSIDLWIAGPLETDGVSDRATDRSWFNVWKAFLSLVMVACWKTWPLKHHWRNWLCQTFFSTLEKREQNALRLEVSYNEWTFSIKCPLHSLFYYRLLRSSHLSPHQSACGKNFVVLPIQCTWASNAKSPHWHQLVVLSH